MVALGAPHDMRGSESTRLDYAKFFNSLPGVLPCGVCGHHLKQHLETSPVEDHLDGKESLFKWTVEVHNAVNRTTGRTEEMTSDQALEYWKGVCFGERTVTVKKQTDSGENSLLKPSTASVSSLHVSDFPFRSAATLAAGIVAIFIIWKVFFAGKKPSSAGSGSSR